MADRTFGKCMLALGSISSVRRVAGRDDEPRRNSVIDNKSRLRMINSVPALEHLWPFV
jgi:hypothetical protein